jgi:hypothetical protein
VPATRKRRLSAAAPTRRLAHEKLWVSDDHKFLRKEFGLEIIYSTVSDQYCQDNNLDITTFAGTAVDTKFGLLDGSDFKGICKDVCDELATFFTANPPKDDRWKMCEDIKITADDTDDFALCGYTREECESLCTDIPECAGFDYHKTVERCWLNNVTATGPGTCPDIRNGLDHDLVTKVYADACQVTIEGTPQADGVYVQGAPPAMLPNGASELVFALPGTGKKIIYGDALPSFWAVMDGPTVLYAVADAFVRTPTTITPATSPKPYPGGPLMRANGYEWSAWRSSGLFNATCPDLGITVGFHCLQDEMCQTFGYCMLSSERLTVELETFRDGEDLVAPICEIAEALEKAPGNNITNGSAVIKQMIGAYTPKVVADTDRLEYVIDMTAFRHTADGHYLHQELFRDGSSFRIRVRDLGIGTAFDMGVISMFDAYAGELSADYMAPTGFTPWVTDVMRFELFDEIGLPIPAGTVTFDMYLPMHSEKTPVILFVKSAAGWGVPSYELKPQPLHPEPGWYEVTLPFSDGSYINKYGDRKKLGYCNALEVAGAMDFDDCPTSVCEENAVCVNQFGKPYTCECLPGWKLVGTHCVATEWTEPKMTMLHIENDSPLTNGWRVQEVKLYSDTECKSEMIDHTAYGMGPNGWSWRMFNDAYLPMNNYVPAGADTNLLCKSCNGCSAEGSFGPAVDADSSAFCVPRKKCLELCAAAADCMSIDMHEYLPRCFLNQQTGQLWTPSTTAEDVHYEYWEKQPVVSVTASSSFEWHPAGLVNDGSMNSEWWSETFRKGPFQEYLDFSLTQIGAPKAIKVFEALPVDKMRVSLALSGRPESLDVPGMSHVQHAESGMEVEDRTKFTVTTIVSAEGGPAQCVPLTCGEPMFFATPTDKLASFEDVPSPCHCKQMCLDHVDEGCRSWLYYDERDTNYYTDMATHGHMYCTLYTVAPSAHKPKKMSQWAMSGGVDLVLFGLSPETAPVGSFALTVKAAGLPAQSSKQRIKVVMSSCAEDPVAEAVGLSCSSPYVCHPQPSAVEAEAVSWTIDMLPKASTAIYKVCYCAGVCYSAGQWTMVPGTLTVPPATVTFTAPPALTAYSDPFTLKFSTGLAKVAILPAFGGLECSDWDGSDGYGQTASGIKAEVLGGVTLTHKTTIVSASYGSYKVCGLTGTGANTAIFDVPSLADGPYLVLQSTDADAVRTAGIFRNSVALSTPVGATVTLKIPGAEMDWESFKFSSIAIGAKGAVCGTGVYLDEMLHDVNVSYTDSTTTELGFPMTVPADVKPGKYPICLCTEGNFDANVTFVKSLENRTAMPTPYTVSLAATCAFSQLAGDLVITRRVHVGKDFVLDPMDANAAQVSLEITGSDLDYTKDRIMVINCQDTCGRAEPSEYVFPKEGTFLEALAVNDKSYSGELPVADPYTVDGMYTEYADRYCRLNNIMTGAELITQNLCYPKCSNGCMGDACFCDGFYQGFDTEESAALCLPRVECEHLCTLLGDACFGIDMHESNNRCFLNGPGCAAQLTAGSSLVPGVAEGLGYDTSYSFLVKSELPSRQLQEVQVNWASSARGDLVLRPGVSTTYNLRFSDLMFTSAGRFKVCFCDSEHGPCKSTSDFAVEIGYAHVSGVHCLLTVPKLRATKCYQQYYGGLSCSADLPVAPVDAPAYPSSYGTFPSP